MDTQLRNKLLNIFKKLIEDDKLFSLFLQLKNGNYYIELSWSNWVWNDFFDQRDYTPLGYLYDNRFFETRIELRTNLRISKQHTSKHEIAKDLSQISNKLANYEIQEVFQEIEDLLKDYNNQLKAMQVGTYNEVGIEFMINGLNLLSLNGIDWDEGIEYGFTEEDYIEKLHISTDISNICEQDFFKKFNQNSQFFLKAGTQLLEIFYDLSSTELLDHSPLLINFIKAIESETKDLFDLYQQKIFMYTPIIVQNIKLNLSQQRLDKDLIKLSGFCKLLNIHMSNFKPSGLKPLYFILKFFFLREQFEITGVSTDIISEEKKKILLKDRLIIDEIFRKGELRNDYIHYRVIDSKNEFLWHYANLYAILQVLASIK